MEKLWGLKKCEFQPGWEPREPAKEALKIPEEEFARVLFRVVVWVLNETDW